MPTHVFDFLNAATEASLPNFVVVYGDEPFLKTLAMEKLRREIVGAGEDYPFATFDGSTAEWRDVMDEVATVSLFGGGNRRLAVVDEADKFVTAYRSRLEDYAAKPASSGILLLNVSTWPSNTRLYKTLDKTGLQIDCSAPQKSVGKRSAVDEGRVVKWLTTTAKETHGMKLQPMAAQLLLELVGIEFGLLNQDLAKLALFTDQGGEVTAEMVRDIVGGWKTKTMWEVLDLVCDGNSGEALKQLDHLLQAGENPLALFGQIAWSLRRFAAATRIFERAEREGRRMPLSAALEQAGFRRWPRGAMENAERQLKQMGRDRAGQLYRWLLEADLALKLSHSTPERARLVLELLFARLDSQLNRRKSN